MKNICIDTCKCDNDIQYQFYRWKFLVFQKSAQSIEERQSIKYIQSTL